MQSSSHSDSLNIFPKALRENFSSIRRNRCYNVFECSLILRNKNYSCFCGISWVKEIQYDRDLLSLCKISGLEFTNKTPLFQSGLHFQFPFPPIIRLGLHQPDLSSLFLPAQSIFTPVMPPPHAFVHALPFPLLQLAKPHSSLRTQLGCQMWTPLLGAWLPALVTVVC